jgi:hypothetical protein
MAYMGSEMDPNRSGPCLFPTRLFAPMELERLFLT